MSLEIKRCQECNRIMELHLSYLHGQPHFTYNCPEHGPEKIEFSLTSRTVPEGDGKIHSYSIIKEAREDG